MSTSKRTAERKTNGALLAAGLTMALTGMMAVGYELLLVGAGAAMGARNVQASGFGMVLGFCLIVLGAVCTIGSFSGTASTRANGESASIPPVGSVPASPPSLDKPAQRPEDGLQPASKAEPSMRNP